MIINILVCVYDINFKIFNIQYQDRSHTQKKLTGGEVVNLPNTAILKILNYVYNYRTNQQYDVCMYSLSTSPIDLIIRLNLSILDQSCQILRLFILILNDKYLKFHKC